MAPRIAANVVRGTAKRVGQDHGWRFRMLCRDRPDLDPRQEAWNWMDRVLKDENVYTKAQLAAIFSALKHDEQFVLRDREKAAKQVHAALHTPLKPR